MTTAHRHDAPHEHEHVHPHAHVSAHNPHAGQGPVVLDLGDGVGALVLRTGPDLVGVEVEISPVGHDEDRRHVEVLPRQVASGTVWAAVYPGLREGVWTVWAPGGGVVLTAEVVGGQVCEQTWP